MTDRMLFDLDEAPERFYVLHHGERHEMATFDDLSINARRHLSRLWGRMVQLEAEQRDLTDSEEREYGGAVRQIVRLAFPSLAESAIDAMHTERREALATAFFTSRLAPEIVRRMTEMASAPAGQPSSPDSSASTDSPTPVTG